MSFRPILKKVALVGFPVFLLCSFLMLQNAHAQTASDPQALITWKASGSYIPSFYQGKALPSYGSTITASLELIVNGRLVNLQSQTIYWYLDENSVGGGTGVQHVSFAPVGAPPSTLYLTVELPQYNGQDLQYKVNIPFVSPAVVIDAPYPANTFSTNPVTLNSFPFFFFATSTAELDYTWAVNGQTGANAENPQVAEITLPQGTTSGTTIDVSLSVQNSVGSTVATADRSLTYQNQL